MRRLTPILAALLLAAPMPALAQVTARYTAGKAEIRIDALPNGDYRVDLPDSIGGLLRLDGVEYVVAKGADGRARVTKLRELIAIVSAQMKAFTEIQPPVIDEGESPLAMDEEGEGEAAVASETEVEIEEMAAEEIDEAVVADAEAAAGDATVEDGAAVEDEQLTETVDVPMPLTPPPSMNLVLTRQGDETVLGYAGEIWGVEPEPPAGTPALALEGAKNQRKLVVMSKDPRLAPLQPPFQLVGEMIGSFMGPMVKDSNMIEKFNELLGKGVPVRVDTVLTLKSVETGPIDPARFELPGPVLQAMDFLQQVGPGAAQSVTVDLP